MYVQGKLTIEINLYGLCELKVPLFQAFGTKHEYERLDEDPVSELRFNKTGCQTNLNSKPSWSISDGWLIKDEGEWNFESFFGLFCCSAAAQL